MNNPDIPQLSAEHQEALREISYLETLEKVSLDKLDELNKYEASSKKYRRTDLSEDERKTDTYYGVNLGLEQLKKLPDYADIAAFIDEKLIPEMRKTIPQAYANLGFYIGEEAGYDKNVYKSMKDEEGRLSKVFSRWQRETKDTTGKYEHLSPILHGAFQNIIYGSNSSIITDLTGANPALIEGLYELATGKGAHKRLIVDNGGIDIAQDPKTREELALKTVRDACRLTFEKELFFELGHEMPEIRRKTDPAFDLTPAVPEPNLKPRKPNFLDSLRGKLEGLKRNPFSRP